MEDLIFPNIQFDESDVGPRPAIPQSGNRIGVAAEFMRGPHNVFQTLGTRDALMRSYGLTTHNGSVAIQTAMDQGANDFGAIRVMGAALPSAAYLTAALPSGVDKIAASGRFFFFTSGLVAAISGSGVGTHEDLATKIARAINESGAALPINASVSGATVTITASGAALQTLPLLFRLGNTSDLTATPTVPTGVLFLDANNVAIPMLGATLPAGAVQRLGGAGNQPGSYKFTVAYGPGATLPVVSSANAVVSGSRLTVGIGGLSYAVQAGGNVDAVLAGVPAVGDKISMTINGTTQTYTAIANDTLTLVINGLLALFTNSFQTANKITLSNVTNTTVRASAQDGSGSVTLALTVTPAVAGSGMSVQTALPVGNLLPSGLAAIDVVKAIASAINADTTAYLIASSQLVDAKNANLFVSSTKPLPNGLTLAGTPTSGLTSATWDQPTLGPITGFQTDCLFHLMLGAETVATATTSSGTDIVSGLATSINQRGLPLAKAAPRPENALELYYESTVAGKNGDQMLYTILQLDANGAIPLTGIDPDFALTTRAHVSNAVTTPVAQGQFFTLGGGVDGPLKASGAFRRKRCITALPVGSLSYQAAAAGPPVLLAGALLTFSAGKCRIDRTPVDLATQVQKVLVPTGTTSPVYVVVDDQGRGNIRSTPNATEMIIGTYAVTGTISAQNLGVFTPVTASREELFLITAGSEGEWANLNVTVSAKQPEGAGGAITVEATYKTSTDENYESETYTFITSRKGTLDGSTNPMVRQTIGSPLIQLTYVGGVEGLEAAILEDTVRLSGGGNGPIVSTADYLAAIDLLSLQPVNIILAAGKTEDAIRNHLITQATNSTEIEGLRTAVLSATPNTRATSAKNQTSSYDCKYAAMVAGWCTYTGRTDLAPLSTPPDGFYAGHMAVTPIAASMAARTSSPAFKGISAVDTRSDWTKGGFTDFTAAHMEAIILDSATRVFHCLNGVSLSVDPAWRWMSIRRVYNYIRYNVFNILQFAKSEPNTPQLRRKVSQSIDNFMFLMFSKGDIAAFNPTKVDDENNPAKLIALGQLRAEVYFTPIYPADFVTVGIHRVIPVSVTA